MEKTTLNASVYGGTIERNQQACDRLFDELASQLQWWVDLLNTVFFKDQRVPVQAITLQKARVTTFGQYVVERNGFGVWERININRVHLDRPMWEILVILTHVMVHGWQAAYGKPSKSWFHNKEFRQKMIELGIHADARGRHLALGDPFVLLLRKHGVSFKHRRDPDGLVRLPPKARPKGRSKLKKWSCGCTNIRVAVSSIEARCLKCRSKFELVS
ncbi:hypothetical protein ACFL0Q_01985 [Thermodesulfobacteriota bacterium]